MVVIDVIIVNYNSTNHALNAIDSINSHTHGISVNIIVVDNASVDRPERIKRRHPGVNLITNKRNLGYSKAINRAMKNSNGDYAVIINPDTVVLNGFFPEVTKYMNHNNEIGVVGPRILNEDGTTQGSARRFPTFFTSLFGRNSLITKLFPNNPFTKKEFLCFYNDENRAMDVDWVSGACMVLKRAAFEKIEGFDENFFLYWEDTDVCKRVKNAGYRVVYYPKAKVTHLVGESSSTRPVESIFHFHHSCFKFFSKHSNGLDKLLTPVAIVGLSARCSLLILLKLISLRTRNFDKK